MRTPGEREACRATSKRSGERCRRIPAPGAVVCHIHGGKSPQAKAKAAERLLIDAARADAQRVLGYSAAAQLADPFEALAKVAAEAVAMKDALQSRVNALETIRYTAPGSGTEQIRAEVQLLERAMDRVERVTSSMIKLDFEGRRVRLAESQGRILADVIRAILDRLDLSSEQLELVPVVVPEELRRVAAVEAIRRSPRELEAGNG